MKILLRYCVGIDVSKDTLQVCLSVIDTDQQVTVKATTSFANQPIGFQALLKWVSKHLKQELPLRYVAACNDGIHGSGRPSGSTTSNWLGIFISKINR
jgi:hypothetical protein